MAVALDSSEVLIGTSAGPGIYVAPAGTAAPTDLETPDVAWLLLGYLSEDGVKLSQSIDTDTIDAWQEMSPIRTVLQKREFSLEFSMIQMNEETASIYFDQATPTATAGEWTMDLRSDATPKEQAFLIITQDGTILMGYHFQRAQLSDTGDLELTKDGEQALPVTMSGMSDDGSVGTVIRQDTAAV